MNPPEQFRDLITRVRAGDPEAARELVRAYEPAVRRAVRFRLTDPRLRAVLDSMDVCQSVFGSFFVRAASGAYDLDRPEQLTGLLAAIARNKLAAQVRRQAADRRDYRRNGTAGLDHNALPAAVPTPSRDAEVNDLLVAVRDRLTPEERCLADLREQGCEWGEIAERLGDDPVTLRKRFSRAIGRVARQLGLEGRG